MTAHSASGRGVSSFTTSAVVALPRNCGCLKGAYDGCSEKDQWNIVAALQNRENAANSNGNHECHQDMPHEM
jgi:hypothetical protein